jgi:hypothetical protein
MTKKNKSVVMAAEMAQFQNVPAHILGVLGAGV